MIGDAIYYILSDTSAITALVSDRIYPINRPQEIVTPAIVYDVYDANANNTKNGISEVDQFNVDVSVWADKYETCSTILDLVIPALRNLKGTYAGVKITSSWIERPAMDQQINTTEIFSKNTLISFRVNNR